MDSINTQACIEGALVVLGFLGLYFLLFSPRVNAPFWLFGLLCICFVVSLGIFVGAVLDIVFRNKIPVFATIGAATGIVAGAYYTFNLYRGRANS